ncbi:hypothetical protein [Actinoplanes palleronii]|uniref:Uncharacterized protein n=1 Tax=Actinoplanes palleronii TaxID=113570 RepID=A0ABQ4BEN3_9ACTN|nr:hypothetical protein [Actinoplanes palleronii]GIE68801.1 hypothetical protein Apa02nite_049090 [Actinoplanes palleronii]
MSAFNVVVVPEPEICPRCGSEITREVQFKYGDRRAYRYAVGDALRWGGNDLGVPARLVRVQGYPEVCPVCGFDPDTVYDVVIRDNVIESVALGTSTPYVGADEDFVVVEG